MIGRSVQYCNPFLVRSIITIGAAPSSCKLFGPKFSNVPQCMNRFYANSQNVDIKANWKSARASRAIFGSEFAQASDKSDHLLNSEHRNVVNCFRSNYYMQSYNSSKYDPFVEKLVGRLGSPKTRQIVIESYNYLTPYNKFSGLQQKDS